MTGWGILIGASLFSGAAVAGPSEELFLVEGAWCDDDSCSAIARRHFTDPVSLGGSPGLDGQEVLDCRFAHAQHLAWLEALRAASNRNPVDVSNQAIQMDYVRSMAHAGGSQCAIQHRSCELMEDYLFPIVGPIDDAWVFPFGDDSAYDVPGVSFWIQNESITDHYLAQPRFHNGKEPAIVSPPRGFMAATQDESRIIVLVPARTPYVVAATIASPGTEQPARFVSPWATSDWIGTCARAGYSRTSAQPSLTVVDRVPPRNVAGQRGWMALEQNNWPANWRCDHPTAEDYDQIVALVQAQFPWTPGQTYAPVYRVPTTPP